MNAVSPAPLDFGVDIPFVTHLGFALRVFAEGRCDIHYTPRPEHLNSFGVTHGGALMTLLDVTMACAARSQTPELGVVTIEMKTSFMQPAVGPLTAQGALMHRTATMAFTQATVVDAQGKVCAHATGTFKYMKRLATADRAVHALHPTAQAEAQSATDAP
ncbi:MAG: PaaI family thioesterase [Rhodoferax sp.]|nr:PaaI family thioesterase [Rhodoferax sp.]